MLKIQKYHCEIYIRTIFLFKKYDFQIILIAKRIFKGDKIHFYIGILKNNYLPIGLYTNNLNYI